MAQVRCPSASRIWPALVIACGKDVFVHISAVEKAGLSDLREGANVSFDIVANRGKESAENLRVS
jgi:cold shock CspA family protein